MKPRELKAAHANPSQALTISEARFAGIVRISEDAIISIDETQKINLFNEGAERIFGYEAAEALGQAIDMLIPARFLAAHHSHIHNFSGSADSLRAMNERGAIYGLRKTGEECPAEASISKFEVAGEKVLTVRLRDLTEVRKSEEALRKSEATVRALLESASQGVIAINPDGDIMLVNAKTEELFGYTREELLGEKIEKLLPARLKGGHIKHRSGYFTQPRERPMGLGIDLSARRKDGSEFPVEISLSFVKGQEGTMAISFVTDITERKMAEEVLKLSQARFAGIVRISEDAIISIGENQAITMFNDGAEKIFGYSAEEVLGNSLEMLIPARFLRNHHKHVESFARSADALRPMNERGAIFGMRKDGSEFPAEASISKFEVGSEKVLTVRLRDLTEHRKAEEALRKSEATVRALLESASQGVVAINARGLIMLVNAKTEQLFGYLRAELLDHPIEKLLPERLSAKHIGHRSGYFQQPRERPMGLGMDLSARRKDGTEFPVEISLSYVAAEDGNIAISFITDITERKAAEQQIRASLEEKEILLKEIHHRVKNNLQVVSSLLSLQSGYTRDEPVRDLFLESQNRVKSMALIHEKLYQSGDMANIDFADYIETLSRSLFQSYTSNQGTVTLETSIDVSLGIDHAIPCGLIVNELLSNSLKHAFPDGRHGVIRLNFHTIDDQFILIFSDDGVGMPENIDFKNTGTLGLQLVTTLTEQLTGDIIHRAAPGTEFEIRFRVPQTKSKKGK